MGAELLRRPYGYESWTGFFDVADRVERVITSSSKGDAITDLGKNWLESGISFVDDILEAGATNFSFKFVPKKTPSFRAEPQKAYLIAKYALNSLKIHIESYEDLESYFGNIKTVIENAKNGKETEEEQRGPALKFFRKIQDISLLQAPRRSLC